MLSEAFWTPNTASLQFVELPERGLQSKSSPNSEWTKFTKLFSGSLNTLNEAHEANVHPIKNRLYGQLVEMKIVITECAMRNLLTDLHELTSCNLHGQLNKQTDVLWSESDQVNPHAKKR